MMLDDSVLDEVLPIPDIDELKAAKVQELQEQGFVITNFNSGGIFNLLLMMVLHMRVEFVKLLRQVLKQMFVTSADGLWLQLKAADYSKTLKQATKTQGVITLQCADAHSTLTIPKGTVFKTQKDINGDELSYFSTDKVILLNTEDMVQVPVEAEKPGSAYNVPKNQITECLIYLEGVEQIYNAEDWLTSEGSDEEEPESLRERTLNAWADLSSRPIALTYKNAAEAIPGVLYATVDDMHPRGQGTVDIVITSTAGAASEELLGTVREAIDAIKGEYDNILVMSAETVAQDIQMVITMPYTASTAGVEPRARAAVLNYFKISTERTLSELMLLDILYAVKTAIPAAKNIKITEPLEDVVLDNDKVIILGDLTITVEQED